MIFCERLVLNDATETKNDYRKWNFYVKVLQLTNA